MAYLDKWLSVFPKIVGQETRPENGIDDTLEFNTDGFPQRIASDPVRYDLENAMGSQLFSNDKRLKEITDQLKQQAGAHEKDPRAHSTGIAGNAATATKLNTARTIAISGKVTGAATAFDGSKNISINTTAVTADNCTGNSATASKLASERDITLSGKVTGTGSFDGSRDANINVTAVTADNCTGNSATATYATSAGSASTASKLASTHTIAISGKVTGTATGFDGSKNISINATAVTADNCTGNSATATYATSAGSATSASNATNATNDNAGQNIRNTYIKNLSISGRTITFTRGDNTTGQIITQDTSKEYDVMVGASSYYNGTSGLVPAPKSGDNTRFLAGDGTWKPQSTIATSCTGNSATATNATNDSYGQNIRSTYIKALSCSGTRITYTRGDNTTGYFYTQDTNTTYNDFSGAGSYYSGSHGLVPAPSSGYQDRFLAGSGDWEAFSAAYQAMQSLSPSSDKIPYFTGRASAALATLTSFARSILDDTSAEAVRGTIGANAQNCGGIVAASLTQNGYVKFATGLIIQWGIITVSTDNAQGPHQASQALPVTASNFLQGTAVYDYPGATSIPVAAISCNATAVTAGAQLLPGYTGDPLKIRWIALFN